MRWAVLLLLVCALPALAPALAGKPGPNWPLIAQDPDGRYELGLTGESPTMPLYTPDSPWDAHTRGERLAFLAGQGNKLAIHQRETQESRRWFLGKFKPAEGATILAWPHGQTLVITLDDGRQLTALELVVTRGHHLLMGPLIPIMPARAISFAAFEVEFPQGPRNLVLVAFPPGKWDAAKAITLEIRKEAGS